MVEKTIVDLRIVIGEKEKELASLDRWIPLFKLFYTKEDHVNLRRLLIYMLVFVSFFYAFRMVAVGYVLSLLYNVVVFLGAGYIFALYHVSHKHDVLKKTIADLQKELSEYLNVLNSKKRRGRGK